jgi:quinol monooxygenase YgiN
MKMITVVAIVESSAEDIDAMLRVIAEMETASRAEAGCQDYTFCQEVSNPSILRINELWDSMDALTAHFATPHMASFNAAIAARPPKSMTLRINELGEELSLPS